MDTRKHWKWYLFLGVLGWAEVILLEKIYVRCEKITGNVLKLYFILRMGRGRIPWGCSRKWAHFTSNGWLMGVEHWQNDKQESDIEGFVEKFAPVSLCPLWIPHGLPSGFHSGKSTAIFLVLGWGETEWKIAVAYFLSMRLRLQHDCLRNQKNGRYGVKEMGHVLTTFFFL